MKAIRVHEFGEPEKMQLEEVEDPRCGPGQVLVKVHAVGVNPVETYIRAGIYAIKPQLPYIPGSDASGTVQAVGEGVKRFTEKLYKQPHLGRSYWSPDPQMPRPVHETAPSRSGRRRSASKVLECGLLGITNWSLQKRVSSQGYGMFESHM